MRKLIYITLFIFVAISCKKKHLHNNDNIGYELGTWEITEWSYTTFSNGVQTSQVKESDIGSFELNNVNYGDESEGVVVNKKNVASPIRTDPSAGPCYETFTWLCDARRITFGVNWCNQGYYEYNLEGFKKKKQTWTRVVLDPVSGAMIGKEVFKVQLKK